MPTDDERREVAERLRGCRGGWSSGSCYYTIINALGLPDTSREDGGHALYSALADLIEPARGSGGRSILCAHCESASWCGCEPGDLEGGCDFEPRVDEGEPPYNLYSLYEAVLRRRPRDKDVTYSRSTCGPDGKAYMVKVRHRTKGWERDFYAVDREALLGLAEEMDKWALTCDHYDHKVSPLYVTKYAEHIREACGVVA